MELDGRNQLINFKNYAASTLIFADEPHVTVRAGCRYLDVIAAFPEDTSADVAKRAGTILKQHLSNLEERGVATLMIASQLVSWQADGKRYRAPVAMQRLENAEELRRGGIRNFALVDDSAEVNPILLPLLRDVMGIPGAARGEHNLASTRRDRVQLNASDAGKHPAGTGSI
jgi:hypothetical protein